MLLAIDVGNTNTVIGIYKREHLLAHWRISTERTRTTDEYGILLEQLIRHRRIHPTDITGVVIASVVPPVSSSFVSMSRTYFGSEPLVIDGQTRTGLRVLYHPPEAVGADRLANAVAAQHKHRLPAIIADMGTATTFDVVSADAEYLGGAIMPGTMISLEALSTRAARLPRIDLRRPDRAIGVDTEGSMRAGVVYGAAGAVDALVQRIRAELPGDPIVIATGGLARVIAAESREIQVVDEHLTLDGLRLIYDLNAQEAE